MNATILTALAEKRLLAFTYNGRARVVEPQCYGIGARGTELLRAFQRRGGPRMEPLFDVAKMDALTVLPDRFERPGPHYRQGDSAMKTIYAQL
jgi:hypothetical protein